jgi:tetratricopeptide (TPR) repeat protein
MILSFAPIDRTLQRSGPRPGEWEARERLLALRDALMAICDERWDDAEKMLTSERALRDASFLNLLGIVHQARRQWKQARRFYGKAMKADRSYAPAEQNMRRLYELHTFGRTDLPIALIDLASAWEVESRFASMLMRQ